MEACSMGWGWIRHEDSMLENNKPTSIKQTLQGETILSILSICYTSWKIITLMTTVTWNMAKLWSKIKYWQKDIF